jgi:hypothetical protein
VLQLQALTVIDEGTGWPKFIATQSKSSQQIAILFNGTWLCLYPHPGREVFDNGGEFIGGEFQELLVTEKFGCSCMGNLNHNMPRVKVQPLSLSF